MIKKQHKFSTFVSFLIKLGEKKPFLKPIQQNNIIYCLRTGGIAFSSGAAYPIVLGGVPTK
jgi:hypothetical protein